MVLVSFILSLLWATFPAVSDSTGFATQTLPVHFRWDNTTHDKEYMGGGAAVDSLASLVAKVGADNINSIEVTAYASPEGVYEHNMMLSRQRAKSLKTLLIESIPDLADKFNVIPGGEAWELLRARVAVDSTLCDASRERVLKILDNTTISDDTRKWRLANWSGTDPKVGNVYKYLLRAHYKYLRCGDVNIVFRRPLAELLADVDDEDVEAEVAAPVSPPVVPGEAKEPVDTVAPAVAPDAAVPPDVAVAPKPLTDSTLTQTLQPESLRDESAQMPEGKPVKCHDRVPILGVSTNLLYDVTYIPGYGITSIPSLSLEYYPRGGRWTIGADVEWPMWKHWDTHDFMQINNITLWVRRYFKPDLYLYKGAYLFGNVNAAQYGIGWDDKGWEGEGLGGSLGIGYKKYFGNSRFYFDTGLAAGVFWSQYDPYFWGNEATGWYYYDYAGKPEDFRERSKHLLWFGPTRLYFSIGYDLLMRKRR